MNTWRETECPTQCPEGQITQECECGTEYYRTGYCCNDMYQTTECAIPCTPQWQCNEWSSCTNGTQTRTCTDINQCGEPDYNETQSCGECTEGTTQNCTTIENCPGTQTCTNGTWETCQDIPEDNCPPKTNQQTTTILATILIIGIIILIITKTIER
jgi:hypothetical protein